MGEIQLNGLYGVSLQMGLYVFTFVWEKHQPEILLVKHEALYIIWNLFGKQKQYIVPTVIRISGYINKNDKIFSNALRYSN